MHAIHPESSPAPTFKLTKVGNSTGLYRLMLPGDKPEKPTGAYYALVKRGSKQFRRSLKTWDRKLAEHRLQELRGKIGNLSLTDDARTDFSQAADRWLAVTGHTLKPRSVERRRCSLKGYFRDVALRNVTKAHCERWLTERGPQLSAQSFAHELGTMKAIFDHAVEAGLILGNPASHTKRRRIPQAQMPSPVASNSCKSSPPSAPATVAPTASAKRPPTLFSLFFPTTRRVRYPLQHRYFR
jgi:hypothetical protein